MKETFHVLLFISLSSCGLKVTNETYENLLYSSWSLTNIICYKNGSSSFSERYDFSDSSDTQVELELGNADMQYTVESSTCTTSAHGSFITDFDDDLTDELDFTNVVSGSTCDINTAYVGGDNSNGTATVNFALLASKSKDLTWEVSEDRQTLDLDFFTGFEGSNVGNYCGSECECIARFEKI